MPNDLLTKNLIEILYWLVMVAMWVLYVFWVVKSTKKKAEAVIDKGTDEIDANAVIGTTQSTLIKFILVAGVIVAANVGLWIAKQWAFSSPPPSYNVQAEAKIKKLREKEPEKVSDAKAAADTKKAAEDKKHNDSINKAVEFFDETRKKAIEESTTKPKGQ